MIAERTRERRRGLIREQAKGQAVVQYLTKLEREERGRSNLLRAKGLMLAVRCCVRTTPVVVTVQIVVSYVVLLVVVVP